MTAQGLPMSAAAVAIAGSGTAFPVCKTPWGESLAALDTVMLVDRLAPEIPDDRRAFLRDHLLEATGIRSRSWSRWVGGPPQEGESDAATLALDAARAALADAALADAALPGSELAAVVVATSTAPRWTSAVSARLSGELGARCAFLDVRSGCAGGLWALVLGAQLCAGARRPVLVVGCDTFSKLSSPRERLLALSTGDGAGALVLAPGREGQGLVGASFSGDGSLHDLVSVPTPMPPPPGEAPPFLLTGDPDRFLAEARRALGAALASTEPLLGDAEVLRVIQSGQRSVQFKVSEEVPRRGRVWTDSLAVHGNLNAATVPVALHEIRRAGVAEGRPVQIAAVGGGLSFGGAVWSSP